MPNNVSGRSQFSELDKIQINRVLYTMPEMNKTKIYQHEFAHALGMRHLSSYYSIRYFTTSPYRKILESDKRLLKEYYKCR